MISLQKYCSGLINESYKNYIGKDEIKSVAKEAVEIFNKSYEKIGGWGGSTVEDLLNEDDLWMLKVWQKDGIRAAVAYKRKESGELVRKMILCGTDGTEEGKRGLYKICKEDIERAERGFYAEVSGAVEHIYTKFGARPVSNDLVEKIINKKIEKDEDGYHYYRDIAGTKRRKLIVLTGKKVSVSGEKSVKESLRPVRYFHPKGLQMPNGSNIQKGGFLLECARNSASFILTEAVHGEQYGLSDWRGGVIVFATSVNSVQLDSNPMKNKIKQLVASFNNRNRKDSILTKIINAFNKNRLAKDEIIGAYSVGKAFKGKYVDTETGQHFNDRSYTIEVNGLSSPGLLLLAAYIARVFKQQTVLVKDLNKNKIYLADGHYQDLDEFEEITLDGERLNKLC